jgi:endo-1,4-beta-D-glucanase Y
MLLIALGVVGLAFTAGCDDSNGDGDADSDVDGDGDADSDGDSGLGHPFGTHEGYHEEGVISPAGYDTADLDDATAEAYDAWKDAYLEPACEPGHYRVRTSPATSAYTVSEGHGYGMLITVLMAGHEPEARVIFDGLHAYFVAHPSGVDPNLMAWAQDRRCENVEGDGSATDGDLDIAFALLLAHRQWGSNGAVDYRGEAARVITAILDSEVHQGNFVLVGDWASDPSDSHHTGTRPSDFMVDHFRAFHETTGEPRWSDVIDTTYAIVNHLQEQYAARTGLLPDFVVDAQTASPSPAPQDWLEGENDGRYGWNACRVPWRLAMDYLVSGDPRARDAVRRINEFFRDQTGDDPTAVVDGYELDGRPVGDYDDTAFVAPLAVAAMIEPATGTNGPWLDRLWDDLTGREPGEYYGDSLRLLSMIVVSGNWFAP